MPARDHAPVWLYLILLVCTIASDSVPIVGMPAWMIMVLFWSRFDLQLWVVLVVGVTGSTLGRLIFSLYAPKLSERYLKRRKTDELAFVARKLEGRLWRSWLFVFLYALTPLSTTVLFLAVGLGRVHLRNVLPPFFAGKFVIDTIMVLSGRYAVESVTDLWHGTVSWKGLGSLVAGLLVVVLLLFVDWRRLVTQRQLRLTFRILK